MFTCFHNPPKFGMDFGIFNLCKCQRMWLRTRCTGTLRESALINVSGKSIAAPGKSNLLQRRAGPALYQLNYIPAPLFLSSSHLSLKRGGRWGTTDDFTARFLHFSLLSTALWDLANSRPVHLLMLSTHLFFCQPLYNERTNVAVS